MCSILTMKTSVIFTLLTSLFLHAADACPFPSVLQGTWTSSNYGTFTIGSSYLHMTKVIITGSSGTNFTCILNSGNLYIVQSMLAFLPFTGASTYYRAYICFDMRAVTSYSYYYYQQSPKETGFSNERIVGLANGTTVTSMSQVCQTTLNVSEYHTLVKTGYGSSALVTCPDVMLGNYYYKYNDTTGSYCTNTTVMDVCSNKSAITFNYTQCSQRMGYSAGGIIGCIIIVSSGSTTYLTTYNFDTNVDGSTTYRYTCWAMAYSGSNVIASIKPSDCDNGQSPTTLPTGGAILTMTPYYTCLPTSTTPTKTDYTALIVGLVVGFIILIIIVILIIYFCCFWWPPRRRNKLIRAKKQLEVEDHPMAEKSLELDAPMSLDPISESEAKLNKWKGKKGKGGIPDPMRETSMMLNFKERTWILGEKQMANGKQIPNGIANGGPIRHGGLTVADLETGSVMGPSFEEALLSSRSNAEFKTSRSTAKVGKTEGETTRSITSIALTTRSKGSARKAPGSKLTRGKTSIGPMTVTELDETNTESMADFVAAESATTSKPQKKSPQLRRGKTATTLSKAKSVYSSQTKVPPFNLKRSLSSVSKRSAKSPTKTKRKLRTVKKKEQSLRKRSLPSMSIEAPNTLDISLPSFSERAQPSVSEKTQLTVERPPSKASNTGLPSVERSISSLSNYFSKSRPELANKRVILNRLDIGV